MEALKICSSRFRLVAFDRNERSEGKLELFLE